MKTGPLLESAEPPNLALRVRTIVEGALTGLHRAKQHGSSVEFAQHKEYSPGDEIRHIDWKHHAKHDRYHVKQFEQESELTAHLIVDASASMNYGEPGATKLSSATTLAAALSYVLVRQRDRVGLLPFGDRSLERYIAPSSRPGHLHDLFGVMESLLESGGRGDENLSHAIERSIELVGRRRSLIVVCTDLFDASGTALPALGHLRARGHDVVLFHILHRDELTLPFSGLTKFEDLESSRTLLTAPAAVRREYKKRLRAFLQHAKESCISTGVEYRPTDTAVPVGTALMSFLGSRATGRQGGEVAAWDF